MSDQFDPSRRSLVKLLSSAPLLPLAGGGAAGALLAACGGGDSASSEVQLKTATFSSSIAASAAFIYPGLNPTFDAAVTGLNLVEDMKFGSSAMPSGSPVGIAIKSLTELATLFYPLQGVFNAYGQLSGTGPTTINSEVQRYATQFNPQNHVLEADGLRLQAVLGAGHYDSYLRGSIVTGTSSNGFTAGADGQSSPTRLVDIGLTAANLPNIEIGTCITGGSRGLAVVVAKDAAAGTITFEAVTSGVKLASKENFHLTFTKFAFARVAADVIDGTTTTTIQFKTPVASTVVPGMFALGVIGVSPSNSYANLFQASDRAKVLSISADRLFVTFDSKVNFKISLKVLSPTGDKTGDGVLFVPGLTSGQIWSKRAYGPQQVNHQVQAVQVEFTMPAMPQFAGGPNYTKSAIESAMASAPGTMWGYWPAVWLYNFKPVLVPAYTFTSSEVDMLEVFTHVLGGQSTWTGYLHTQPYTRQLALQPGSTTVARNGGTWKTTAANSTQLNTANAAQLLMPAPIASGTKHTVSVIWTRDKVLHYLDGIPVSESNWAVDTQYPHQLGMNVACGSLASNYAAALFFPQTDAQATSQFLKIHSIKTWEL